jgi:hypothetical protein
VRVLTYEWRDAGGRAQRSRLRTTLLEAVRFPAAALVELYHRCWEPEGAFKEIKGPLAGRPMPRRAREPKRVLPERDGLLLGPSGAR